MGLALVDENVRGLTRDGLSGEREAEKMEVRRLERSNSVEEMKSNLSNTLDIASSNLDTMSMPKLKTKLASSPFVS